MSKTLKIILVILLIVGLVYVVFFTLGRKETIQKEKPKEFKEDRDKARRRYQAFKQILSSKKRLAMDLDWQFNVIYFFARLGLLIVWGLPLLLLFILGVVATMSSLVIYLTLTSILFALLFFLIMGKPFDLSDFNEVLKIRIKNWVYGRYLHLEEDIEEIEKKAMDLKKSGN